MISRSVLSPDAKRNATETFASSRRGLALRLGFLIGAGILQAGCASWMNDDSYPSDFNCKPPPHINDSNDWESGFPPPQ
jgi:hypothetical protein